MASVRKTCNMNTFQFSMSWTRFIWSTNKPKVSILVTTNQEWFKRVTCRWKSKFRFSNPTNDRSWEKNRGKICPACQGLVIVHVPILLIKGCCNESSIYSMIEKELPKRSRNSVIDRLGAGFSHIKFATF